MEIIMTYAQSFFGWLLQTTLIASVVTCLILLIQKMLGGKLGPRWCHALWLVLLIRMILPWAPSSRVSLFNLIPSWDRQIQQEQPFESTEQQGPSHAGQASDTAGAIPAQESGSDVTIQKRAIPEPGAIADIQIESQPWLVSLRRVLPVLWLAGSIVIGAYLLMSNFALWRIVKRDSPLVNQTMLELFEECKVQMGIQSLVVVVPSSQIRSPALFGFIRPRLLLPSEMLEKASREEMRYVFLHELAHLKRHDIYVGWLTSLLQVLHWFNPLVWFAFYRMRADRELACDALVLARTQKEESQEYGQAIVGLVRRFSRSRPLPAMAGILESKSQLKRRITMITQFKKNSYQWSPLAVILIIILACVSLPDAKRTKASGISAAKPPMMVVRRVWIDAADPYFMGAPSPDGKYLSYVDWNTADLAIRELATGKNRRLTNEGWGKGRHTYSIFSPDSKYLACRWRGRDGGGLRIIRLDGSERRFIKHPEGITILRPTNWSTDGKHILALGGAMWDDSDDAFKFLKILFVSVEDGDARVLKTIERLPHRKRSGRFRMSLSPDGRYVAYSFPPADNSGKGDIWVFGTDGGQEIQLVEHPADDFVLAWSPDGNRIVFASDRTGTMGIWAIDVSDGKPEGVPRLLKPEIGRFHPLGLTQKGSYYYGVFSGGSNVYTATFDPQVGNVTGKPVVAIKHYEGSNWAPDWSPDGRYLACLSSGPGATPRLVIQSMETGEVREITPELKELNVHSLRWSADGRSLLGAGSTANGPWGALQVDVKTGEVTTIAQGPVFGPESAHDGKAIFYVRNVRDGGRIVRHDPATGEEKELYNAPGVISKLALSPDGREFAFFESGALKVLPATGGEPRELVKIEDIATIAWTRDGRYLLYGAASSDKTTELWRIAAEGGEPQKLDLSMRGLGHLRFHPDGRRITFRASPQGEKNEVWVMENFLPEAPVAKPPGMVVRRVWANAWDPSFMGVPSADGKYLSFVNWKTGDMAVHELSSGKDHQLTNEGWDKGFAGYSVFSPDGKQVAYYWWDNEKVSGQLRIVGLDGSEPRVVHLSKGTSISMPAGWTPDGKHILALGSEDESSAILLIPVGDGEMRVLKTLRDPASSRYPELRRKAGMNLSPDGRYVAYTFLPGEDSANGDISVLAVDGSRDISLVRHVADDFVLGWAPDGKRVVFASDRTGSMGIWAIEVADGKPQGTPQLLKTEIGQFNPMGFTKNGSYYYGVAFRGSNVYVATYDPQKGNVTGKPVLTVKRYEGSNEASDWSPDGRYLACVSMRPGEGPVFLIHSVETGKVRELSPDLKDFKVNSLRWSPDGRSLLCAVRNENVAWGVLKIDVETGEVTIIVEGPGALQPNWSADGKAVFYVRRTAEGWRILRRDLTTNEEKELFRPAVVWAGAILGLALSPDGKQLAFQDLDAGMLKVLSVEGGQPRELAKVKVKATIAWAPDGSHLLCAKGGRLLRISADGGRRQRVDLEIPSLNHVRFHPDGRRITFTSRAGGKIEVWVMENFLPEGLGK